MTCRYALVVQHKTYRYTLIAEQDLQIHTYCSVEGIRLPCSNNKCCRQLRKCECGLLNVLLTAACVRLCRPVSERITGGLLGHQQCAMHTWRPSRYIFHCRVRESKLCLEVLERRRRLLYASLREKETVAVTTFPKRELL